MDQMNSQELRQQLIESTSQTEDAFDELKRITIIKKKLILTLRSCFSPQNQLLQKILQRIENTTYDEFEQHVTNCVSSAIVLTDPQAAIDPSAEAAAMSGGGGGANNTTLVDNAMDEDEATLTPALAATHVDATARGGDATDTADIDLTAADRTAADEVGGEVEDGGGSGSGSGGEDTTTPPGSPPPPPPGTPPKSLEEVLAERRAEAAEMEADDARKEAATQADAAKIIEKVITKMRAELDKNGGTAESIDQIVDKVKDQARLRQKITITTPEEKNACIKRMIETAKRFHTIDFVGRLNISYDIQAVQNQHPNKILTKKECHTLLNGKGFKTGLTAMTQLRQLREAIDEFKAYKMLYNMPKDCCWTDLRKTLTFNGFFKALKDASQNNDDFHLLQCDLIDFRLS
jgi:hypothetical protein